MITEVKSFAFKGIDVTDVNIQIHIQNGIPNFSIVGLADKAIAESKERINSALFNLGLGLPIKKIVVNLSPANISKEGSLYDLPIILGILENMEVIPPASLKQYFALGEISLGGKITEVSGVLPAAMHANQKDMGIICPKDNGSEAVWSGNPLILSTNHVANLISHFKGEQKITYPMSTAINATSTQIDMHDVIGQDTAKRAMEVSAAGRHNLLMIGPPGSGKSMLAERITTILPNLSKEEILETSMVNSVAGNLKKGALSDIAPFRSPHHSCSNAAMIGGGNRRQISPGEISLSHNGVLFLDELPEFQRNVIESLRQPLETKQINISRSNLYVSYPANFLLLAAMNPCKCGHISNKEKLCSKAPKCSIDYINRISGPIYDRFDIYVEVPEIKPSLIYKYKNVPRETSADIKMRILKAREIQSERFHNKTFRTNAEMPTKLIDKFVTMTKSAAQIFDKIVEKLNVSMRSYHKIQKISRTIADLDNSEKINEEHLLEAANYRDSFVVN
ncbi:MAG: YifB family Mg chelatase-like AAA ATPase [Rickettsiales bacterium]